jgi:hypothetical protein
MKRDQSTQTGLPTSLDHIRLQVGDESILEVLKDHFQNISTNELNF